jgi:hypothetical protein
MVVIGEPIARWRRKAMGLQIKLNVDRQAAEEKIPLVAFFIEK